MTPRVRANERSFFFFAYFGFRGEIHLRRRDRFSNFRGWIRFDPLGGREPAPVTTATEAAEKPGTPSLQHRQAKRPQFSQGAARDLATKEVMRLGVQMLTGTSSLLAQE